MITPGGVLSSPGFSDIISEKFKNSSSFVFPDMVQYKHIAILPSSVLRVADIYGWNHPSYIFSREKTGVAIVNNNRSRQAKDDVTIEEIIKEREKEEAADNAAFCRSIARKRANRTQKQKLYGYKKNHTQHHTDTQESFQNDLNI
ncbi:MAG: hypothetical protein ACI3XM_02060, partial [Eubacteriales bacterium]